MMGVYGVCNAVGTPLLVMALTSRGPKTLLLVSLALMAVGMAICAATPIYPVILTGRAVMGVGNGTFAATAYIAASRIAGPSRAASAMSNVALGFSASFVFALPAARMLRNVITWQQAYWVLVIAACIAFAVIALVVHVPEAPRSPAEQGRRSTDALRVFRNPCVVLPLICTVLMFVGYASMNTYITPFMESVLPQPEWVSGSLFAFGLMSMIGSKASGWAADRFGSASAVIGCVTLQAVTLVGLGLVTGSWPAALAAACLWTGISWGFLPAQNSFIMLNAGDEGGVCRQLVELLVAARQRARVCSLQACSSPACRFWRCRSSPPPSPLARWPRKSLRCACPAGRSACDNVSRSAIAISFAHSAVCYERDRRCGVIYAQQIRCRGARRQRRR